MDALVCCFKLRIASSLQVLIYPLPPSRVIRFPFLISKGVSRRIIVVTADYLSLLSKKNLIAFWPYLVQRKCKLFILIALCCGKVSEIGYNVERNYFRLSTTACTFIAQKMLSQGRSFRFYFYLPFPCKTCVYKNYHSIWLLLNFF